MRPHVNALVAVVLVTVAAGVSGLRDGPPFDPDDALDTFEIAEGFQIEVFAAEPLVADPVDMEVDEYGRIYVVEMPGYPLDVGGSGRVKLLTDTDADGYPDSSTVFAEGFTLPTGVMRWKDGILVTDAPNVYYLKDTDGDGRADTRDVVLTGFALSNPQHNFNNPLYGLDNGIYLANNGPIGTEAFADEFGDPGSEVRFAASSGSPRDVEGSGFSNGNLSLGRNANNRNVRFRPDTGELESMSSWSQWGHTFDPWGRHFLVGNAHHQFHEVIASRYLERNLDLPVRDVLEFTPAHGNAADVFPITLDPDHQLLTDRGVFTSASGVTWYSGALFPDLFDRVAFVAEPVHNLIHADLVEGDGATFVARRLFESREFLASTDSWFRPVNFYVGPDGALYVIDYYREIVEHPEWMDDEAVQTRDLYSGSDRGRIYRITPESADKPDWVDELSLGDMPNDDLAGLLEHPNAWWRLHAQRLLVDRGGDSIAPALRASLRSSPEAPGRLHAMWTLEGLGLLEDDDIRHALTDPAVGVRENAIRLAERHDVSVFEEMLTGMVDDPDPKVRFQLLLTLGDVETTQAEQARRRILMNDLDDGWVQTAALSAGTPPTFEQLKETVDLLEDDQRPGSGEYLRRLAMLVAASGSASDVKGAVEFVLDRSERQSSSAILNGLAEGIRMRAEGGELEVEHIDALLDVFFQSSGNEAMRAAILEMLRHSGASRVDDSRLIEAAEIASRSDAEPPFRADALALIEISDPESYTSTISKVVRSRPAPQVEAAAIRALGKTSWADLPGFLLDQWPRMSAPGRESALNALMQPEAHVRVLLDAVESGRISPSVLGWQRRVILMRDWDGETKDRARRLLRVSDTGRTEVLRRYQEVLDIEGDPAAGRRVYETACASCHVLDGAGASFGPDLGTVSHWSPHALLEAVLVPSRTIADGYEQWRIERRGGDVFSGILRAETSTAITLAMIGGTEITISRQEIQSMQQVDGSAMPDGIEQQISEQEMADLLAFLENPE